jgi:DNA polymerase-3 subunit beta
MAIQDVRYFLNGMLFEFQDGYLNAVATDGHRLAFARRSLHQVSNVKTSVIVPRKAVIELSKMFEVSDELVSIYVGDNFLRFKFNKLVFTTKLIDGSYPNYQAVIPAAGNRVCIAEKNTLRECFQRTAVLSSEKYRGIKVVLENNKMKTIANNPEQEEAEDEIEVEFKGEKLEAGFNVNYLIEAVSGISGNKVKIVFAEGSNSAIVKEETGEDTLYVVMPMRL